MRPPAFLLGAARLPPGNRGIADSTASALSHPENLRRLLREEIAREHSISFARYMELALYHSDHGYYATAADRTGREGDFYTSVSVGPVFGRLLAVWLADLFEAMKRPAPFTVVEQGAAQGQLAADIFAGLQRDCPGLLEGMRYTIVEPLALLEKAQRQTLSGSESKVRWVASLRDLEPIDGCFISNELVDAFPVHLVRRRPRGWTEQRVTTAGQGFAFTDGPADALDLSELPGQLPEGYTAELHPAARHWMREISARLHSGAVLAIDYGFSAEELYAPSRVDGTWRAFQRHRRVEDPLEAAPGTCDLTAHVNFSALAATAKVEGLNLGGFCDQHHLLVHLFQQLLDRTGDEACLSTAERRGFATLMHPESMGAQFKAIAFTRGIATAPAFRGIRQLPL